MKSTLHFNKLGAVNANLFSPPPLVSAIIPTHNRAGILPRALNSVLRQTLPVFEIIVVDDGSTDATAEVMRDFPTVKYFQTPQAGVSAARNEGARRATGSWLAFLDSDDEWTADKLQKQLELASQNPACSVIHGEEIWIRNGVRVNPARRYRKESGWIFEQSLEVCSIAPSAALIKSDYFFKFRGFPEDFPVCEDYHLWLRMTAADPVACVPDPVVVRHGGHDDQLSSRFKAMDYYRVRAIDGVLESPAALRPLWRKRAAQVLTQKCDILIKGYAKHNNQDRHDEVTALKEKWRHLL